MTLPHVPADWSTSDPSVRREALGALKARLRDSPTDTVTRAELVRAYRQLGRADQAGRFAIALDEGAPPEETRAYFIMLRGLGADENAARRLSLLPTDQALPENVRKALEEGRLPEDWRPWGVFVGIGWTSVVILFVVTMAVAYGFAMAGAGDAQLIAQWWTRFTGWVLLVTLVMTALWCATSSKWTAALVWACITGVFALCMGLATVASTV